MNWSDFWIGFGCGIMITVALIFAIFIVHTKGGKSK